MNKIMLSGRLVRDPEVRFSNNGQSTAVARFTLAVERRFKRDGDPTADFINCTAFGKIAELIEKHVIKGTKLFVEGRWQTGNYTDKNGNKVYTNDCMIDAIEFLEKKEANNNAPTENANSNVMPMPTNTMPNTNGFMNIPSGFEELPFN